MSELKIALVAEGATDEIIINAALQAILPNSFILTQIQPEATQPKMGEGWCGVLKWCHEKSKQCSATLDTDPTLERYDWIIVHLDLDVAVMQYDNCGTDISQKCTTSGWKNLPCNKPCPPVTDTVTALQEVLKSWLQPASAGKKTVFCVPAQSSGTWLAAAHLPNAHRLLAQIECNLTLEDSLPQLSKTDRIRKSKREYQQHAPQITAQWERVKQHCSQAQAFENAILNLLPN